jgi:hypothetical protein
MAVSAGGGSIDRPLGWCTRVGLVTPFQEFRLWLRRAPAGERITGVSASAAVVAALCWSLVPAATTTNTVSQSNGPGSGASAQRAGANSGLSSGTSSSAQPSAGGSTGSGPGGSPTGSSTSVGAAGPVTPGAASTPSATAGSKCVSPPGSAQGISATQIKIAVTPVNIVGPAANSVFGIDSPQAQQAQYQAVIDSINASGGVACRKLVPIYLYANPADQSDMQQKCLDIAQAGVYAVLDPGEYASTAGSVLTCFPQNHVLYFGAYFLPESIRAKFYPWMFAFDTFENLYHNTIYALRDLGFFSTTKGFAKLGFIYRSCYPDVISKEITWMHQVGLSDSQIVSYDFGCPSAYASPSDIEQAILKFQQAGVTNVTYAFAEGDLPNFTKVAQQQGFHPKYGFPDDSMIAVAYGSDPPDSNNIANAVAIVDGRDGEDRTPGMTPTPATAKCMQLLSATPPSSSYPNPQYPHIGNPCDIVWMFAAAVDHAPSLAQTSLVAGLQRAKSVDFAFPQGPNDFSQPGVTTGGQSWRVAQFLSSCNCWQVIEPQFRPSYP